MTLSNVLTFPRLWEMVARCLFARAVRMRSTFCLPPLDLNLLIFVNLVALMIGPAWVMTSCWSFRSSSVGCAITAAGPGNSCSWSIFPFCTSLPAIRAVWIIHCWTKWTAAWMIFSGIFWGIVSGSGRGWHKACIARATRRYCPFALEYSAVEKEEVRIY